MAPQTQWMKTLMEQLEIGKKSDKEFSLADAMKKAGPIHKEWKKQNNVSSGGGLTKTQKMKKCISKCVTKNRCKTKKHRGKKVSEEMQVATPEEMPIEASEETPIEASDETPEEAQVATPDEMQEETTEAPKTTTGGKKTKKSKKSKK